MNNNQKDNNPPNLAQSQKEEPSPISLGCPVCASSSIESVLSLPNPEIVVFDHPITSTILIIHPKGVDCPRCGGYFAIRIMVQGGMIACFLAEATKPKDIPRIMKPGAYRVPKPS